MNIEIPHLLGILDKDKLDILLCNGQAKLYPKNTMIIKEGDTSPCAFVINSGKVEILLSDEQGKEIVLSILKEGEYFGEMALIDNDVRSAAVKAIEDTRLTAISKKDFRECLCTHPEITEQIMLGLTNRLREANKKISSLALMSVHDRVASTLKGFARKKDGHLVIEEKFTHQHLANIVGASREMISRILRDMVNDGQIRIDRKNITILNLGNSANSGRG